MISIIVGVILFLIFAVIALTFFTGIYTVHTQGFTAGDIVTLFAMVILEVVLFKILFLGGFSL